MIECNNVIPKIITISPEDNSDEHIAQFANALGIAPSHRIVVSPEKDELTVEQIHLMQKDIQVSFSKMVLVVLLGLDVSSLEVQNSLLKCLEEDAERIQFLFLVHNPLRLVAPILSRCTVLNSTETTIEPKGLTDISDIFSLENNTDSTKELAVEKINRYIRYSHIKDYKALHHILTIRKLIMDNNLNPILALDSILLFLSKTSTIDVRHEK